MSDTLRVVAHLKAQPGKADELRGVLLGLIEPTHAEEGCIRYELHAHVENEGEFTFIEEWRSPADLDGHFETAHIQAALGRLPELLAEELDLRPLQKIG